MSEMKNSIKGKITMPAKPLIINDLDYSMELSDEELTSCCGGLYIDVLPNQLDVPVDVNVQLGNYTLDLSANGSVRCASNPGVSH